MSNPDTPSRRADSISDAPVSASTTDATLEMRTSHRDLPTTDTPALELQSGTVVGQYELIRQLGVGGMGAVYLARDIRLGRRVAIKFLARRSDRLARRFQAEARATARCKHDNIVVIHDVGEAHGLLYMVLEYLEGITLATWLTQRRGSRDHELPTNGAPGQQSPEGAAVTVDSRVPPARAVEMMMPVIRALAHAHELGLVHRDLKPANIMLADDGSVKVLDFGIAKVLDRPIAEDDDPERVSRPSDTELAEAARVAVRKAESPTQVLLPWAERGLETRAGAFVGTTAFMSPEQTGAGDGEIDQQTDIWAVGILFWLILTGRHPVQPLTRSALRRMARSDAPLPVLADIRPDVGPLGAIVDRCLSKPKTRRTASAPELLKELEPLLPRRRAATHSDGDSDNPYVGLAAFQRIDAERFFGRERDIASILAMLRNHRLVTVAGTSGAGKSSLIRAGVIPALERSGQLWESFIVRPGRQPLAAMAEVLDQAASTLVTSSESGDVAPAALDATMVLSDSVVTELSEVPDPSSRAALVATLRHQPGYLGVALRSRCHRRRARALLFIDQFEELYTLGADRDTREAFVRCLEGVADDASSPLRVILSVRSDFLDRVAEDRTFTSELMRGMTLLSPLSREQLRQALISPLTAAGYTFESETLVEEMLDTLQATRSPLPLLQFTAARLWHARDRDRKRISRSNYRDLGGIEGALATHADAVLASLSAAEQRLVRAVLTNLVSDERTRAIVGLDELRASARSGDDGAIERVVTHLAAARLVLVETDSEGAATIELIHESLIERWPKLVHWLDEEQDAEQFRTRVRTAARQWDKQGRPKGLLWRDQAAEEAERWNRRAASTEAAMSERDRDYLRAVVSLAVRARRRRRGLAVASFALITAVAIAVAFLAARADREARQARTSTVRAENNAVQARNASRMASAREHKSDPTLVLALVREMEPAAALPPRWRELARWAMYQDVARAVIDHPGVLYSAVFSPDGTRIVTAGRDHTAQIWNADGNGAPVILHGHTDVMFYASFSPDGQRVVTASLDDTARVWTLGPPDAQHDVAEAAVLLGHREGVTSAAFSPDGERVVTASFDKTALVWNADGSGPSAVFEGHADGLSSAFFSPDGTRIVTASFDKTARVWNAGDRTSLTVLRGHSAGVSAAAFSPDGTRIVTASFDKTARVWNADGTGPSIVLRGHQDRVRSAAFSPDGTRVATASQDRTVRLWNADGSSQATVLEGHQARVYSAAFSPDGTRVVSASWDHSARVWDASGHNQPVHLKGHTQLVYSAVFSPNGARVATASGDRTVRVWEVADLGAEPVVLKGHEGQVLSVSFNPEGTRLVSASWDKTARVWSLSGTEPPVVLSAHQAPLMAAAFSPRGDRVVTASADKTARVWAIDGSDQPVVLAGHSSDVTSAAFGPDGERVVTASYDKTVRVWNVDGSGQPIVLTGHQAEVNTAGFSPDGTRIMSASYDKTARLWNADGSGRPVILTGYDGAVGAGAHGAGAFTPDGAFVVTLSDDKTMRLWDAAGVGPPAILRMLDIDAYSASFSPDGARIITASHAKRNLATGDMEHWATVWPAFERFTGLSDPVLWTATTYCPPVALRTELLGVPKDLATEQLRNCQARVVAARSAGSR